MGIKVKQKAILGIKLTHDECYHQKSPAVYDEQPRYDPKTGIQTHTENVLVKAEQNYFQFGDIVEEDEYFEYFIESVAEANDLQYSCDDENDVGYIGYNLELNTGSYNFDLLEGSLPLDWIEDNIRELKSVFPDREIQLHFVGYVG
jgi:hypothetical protein